MDEERKRKRERNKRLKEKKAEIRAWFDRCDPETTQTRDALKRAAKMIWDYQTPREQDACQTVDDNGVGYNGYDADFAGRIVKWRGTLSPKMAFAAQKICRPDSQNQTRSCGSMLRFHPIFYKDRRHVACYLCGEIIRHVPFGLVAECEVCSGEKAALMPGSKYGPCDDTSSSWDDAVKVFENG